MELDVTYFFNDDEQLMYLLAHVLIISAFASLYTYIFCGAPSPYGRYSPNEEKWTHLNASIGWFIQEVPAFLVPVFLMLFNENCKGAIINKLLMSMFLSHYFQRSFIYPLLVSKGKKMQLKIVTSAFCFCAFNGFLQGYYTLCVAKYSSDYYYGWNVLIGIPPFITGMIINIHSDRIVANLRKTGDKGRYKIPFGGMFQYVSCANYFGEIVEWWGFALATWSYPATAFAIFTSIFLIPRGIYHHRFYKERFSNYPKCRKAIIPFLL